MLRLILYSSIYHDFSERKKQLKKIEKELCERSIAYVCAFGCEYKLQDFVMKKLVRKLRSEQQEKQRKDATFYPFKKIIGHEYANGQVNFIVEWPASKITKEQVSDPSILADYWRSLKRKTEKKFVEYEATLGESLR